MYGKSCLKLRPCPGGPATGGMAGSRAPPSPSHSALLKLKDQLTCSVCLETFRDPRALQCMHVFCSVCLEGLVRRETEVGGDGDAVDASVTCPNCRKVSRISDGGVNALQKPFFIEGLIEARKDLEQARQQGEDEHLRDEIKASASKVLQCSVHNRPTEFYCKDCEKLLCGSCICGEHRAHMFDQISTAAIEGVTSIEKKLQDLEKRFERFPVAVKKVKEETSRALEEEREVQTAIHERFWVLREALDKREKELVAEQKRATQQKLKSLAAKREQFELVRAQLESCRDFVQESLHTGSQEEILAKKKDLMNRVDNALTYSKQNKTDINSLYDVRFSSDENDVEELLMLWHVCWNSPSADYCKAEGKGLNSGKVGREGEVQVSLYDQQESEVEVTSSTLDAVSAELASAASSNIVPCCVEKVEGNKCKVTYTPQDKGLHRLTLNISGSPMAGSPFCVSVKCSLSGVGSGVARRVISGLKQPWGIALHPEEVRVCVSDSGRSEVALFESGDGERRGRVVGRGVGQRCQLVQPSGVAFDRDCNLIVVDFKRCTIQKYSLDHQEVKSVGRVGTRRLEFTYPSAVAYNPVNDKIYIAEWEDNNRVQILNSDLSYYSHFGSSGMARGEFSNPSGLAFDCDGNVYVADSNNARIQVFTADGCYLHEFGKKGRREGMLGLPMGVCMDLSSSVLYITDSLNHRISLFTTDGVFLRSFGTQLNQPQGIAVDQYRFVYVSDTQNNRVVVY